MSHFTVLTAITLPEGVEDLLSQSSMQMSVCELAQAMEYSGVPNHDEHLLLSDRLYVCRSSINKAQIFPKMEDAEGYHHTAERGNPHYDIYFKFDHAAKTVTFALGGEKKVVPLEEYTGWSWKLTGTKLLCGTSFPQ